MLNQSRLAPKIFGRRELQVTIVLVAALIIVTWQIARAQGPVGPRPNPLAPLVAGANPIFAPVPGADLSKNGAAIKIHGDPGHGRSLFAQNCAPCHGDRGAGGIPNPGSDDGTVPSLNPIDPGFLAEATSSSNDPNFPAYYVGLIDNFIQHGSRPSGVNPQLSMIPWGDAKLKTQQEIADLEAYVMSLNGIYWTDRYYPPAEVQMAATQTGDMVLYTINIVNHAGSALTTVMLRDTLPPGMSYDKSGLFGLDVEDKGQLVGTTVQWIAPDIPQGGTLGPFYIQARYKGATVPPNSAEVVFSFNTFDGNTNSGAAAISERVVPAAPKLAQQMPAAPPVAAQPAAPAVNTAPSTSPTAAPSAPVAVAPSAAPKAANLTVNIVQPQASALSWGYDVSTLTASVGDKVTFTNSGSLAHEIAADDGSFDTGNLNAGDSWSFSPAKTGTFAFHCVPHPWMKGTLIVQPALAVAQSKSTSASQSSSSGTQSGVPQATTAAPAPSAQVVVPQTTAAQPQQSVSTSSAQAPAAVAAPAAPKNFSPYDAIYILDNVQRAIPANISLWFKFDYGGDNSPIALTLPNGTNLGVGFKIYHAYQAKRVYQDNVNMGMGTSANGSQDLTWVGATIEPGTYYVEVFNSNSTPQNFVIQIVGTAIDIYGK